MQIKPFILNSIPKSGTHLLLQVVQGMGLGVVLPSITQYLNPHMLTDIARISTLPPNHFLYGHLYFSPSYEQQFKQHSIKQLLMIRDPRDIIASLYYYLPSLPNHPVMRYAKSNNLNKEQIINLIITGIKREGYVYPGTNSILHNFTQWMRNSDVLTVKYEDVLSPQVQNHEFHKILYHLTGGNMPHNQHSIMQSMKNNIIPRNSGTFRKGKSGEWMNEFTPLNIRTFNENCRVLLKDLGYE